MIFTSGIVVPTNLHWNYDELNRVNCQCQLCVDWRSKLQVYRDAAIDTFGHHRSCICQRCKHFRRSGSAYYAAQNRRNTASELAYLTRNERYASGFFNWFKSEIGSGKYTDSWWRDKGDSRPLATWLIAAADHVSGMSNWLLAG